MQRTPALLAGSASRFRTEPSHIVTIYEVDEHEGTTFVAMEKEVLDWFDRYLGPVAQEAP